MIQLLKFLIIITMIHFLVPMVIYSKINEVFDENHGDAYAVVIIPNFLLIFLHGVIAILLVIKRYFFDHLENHNAIYKGFSISNCLLNFLWLYYINCGHAYGYTSYIILLAYFALDIYVSYIAFTNRIDRSST